MVIMQYLLVMSARQKHRDDRVWILKCRFSATILVMGLVACTEAATVTGIAYYRERIALPPDAVFEAVLSNSSIADVVVVPIGQIKIENMPGIPIEFAIPYDPNQIDERFSYSVRATIRVDDQLWVRSLLNSR